MPALEDRGCVGQGLPQNPEFHLLLLCSISLGDAKFGSEDRGVSREATAATGMPALPEVSQATEGLA